MNPFDALTPMFRAAVVAIAVICMLAFGLGVACADPLLIPARADLSWTLPTDTECLDPAATNSATCAKLPLTAGLALTGIAVFVDTQPIADDNATLAPVAVLAGNASSAVYNATVVAGQTLYFRVKARNSYGLSKFSPEVSKVVEVPNVAPGTPTAVTVEFKIGVVPAP